MNSTVIPATHTIINNRGNVVRATLTFFKDYGTVIEATYDIIEDVKSKVGTVVKLPRCAASFSVRADGIYYTERNLNGAMVYKMIIVDSIVTTLDSLLKR